MGRDLKVRKLLRSNGHYPGRRREGGCLPPLPPGLSFVPSLLPASCSPSPASPPAPSSALLLLPRAGWNFFPWTQASFRAGGVGGSQAELGWAVGRGPAGAPRGGGRSEATLPAGSRAGEPGRSVPGGGTGRRPQATGGGGWQGWREEEERPRAAVEGEDGEAGAGAGAGGGHWVPATLELRSGSFWKAFTSAAAKLKRTIEHLKKAQDCIPPCGVQEAARRFHCWGCFSTICDLPLDCPGHVGEPRGPGFVFLHRGFPVARVGGHLFLEICGRRCESRNSQLEGLGRMMRFSSVY
ncbi:sperm acrosome membrane-associated protein 6 isoform X6 [Rattus norvegicus]|uniref:sperm acrosome membrane-associated protein 6 isoform X6 n=1 Tax=Rattus norvegicus TaxID=10116 RepID=UPI0003D09B70|nr:sperm acrosome membrane-associated protein 6 isoform X7 [Rattus norvegicus]